MILEGLDFPEQTEPESRAGLGGWCWDWAERPSVHGQCLDLSSSLAFCEGEHLPVTSECVPRADSCDTAAALEDGSSREAEQARAEWDLSQAAWLGSLHSPSPPCAGWHLETWAWHQVDLECQPCYHASAVCVELPL